MVLLKCKVDTDLTKNKSKEWFRMNKLERKVLQIVEENGGQQFAEDILQYGCQSGIVPELVYYNQTHEWFDTYYDEIMELIEEFEKETGEKPRWEGDLKNWFAWFSFEETVRKLYEVL